MKSIILLALLCGQDLKLEKVYQATPNQYVIITPETKGQIIKYVPLNPGLTILDQSLLKDSKTLVAFSPKAGEYKLLAYTSIDNKPSDPVFTTIIISDKQDDDLAKIIQSVYGADPNPDKAKYKDKLINAFKSVNKELSGLNTVGDLNVSLKSNLSLLPSEGQALRAVLRDVMADTFGTNPDVELDKTKAKNLFDKFIVILGGL